MSSPHEIRAFLAQHNDQRMVSQVPAVLETAANEAEVEFRNGLIAVGYSTSYLALLGLAATLSFDAGDYFRTNDEVRRNQAEWHGYHKGLQTALACLVMHEIGSNPRQAAATVVDHTERLIRCRWSNKLKSRGR